MAYNKIPFINKISSFLLFLSLEVLAIIMITNSGIFYQNKMMKSLIGVYKGVLSVKHSITYYFNLNEVNRELMIENAKLRGEVDVINKAFNDSLDLVPRIVIDNSGFSFVPARAVFNTTNRKHNYIIINKGSKDGILRDMGVISPLGIVGIVGLVSENFSVVISFLNIEQSVSAKIKSSNSFGPMVWDGFSPKYALLTEIPQHIRISVGDTVVTSGYSTIFPPNVPLGTIRKSKIVKGIQHEIRVNLFEDFSTLEYVNVVVSAHKEEIKSLINNNENEAN